MDIESTVRLFNSSSIKTSTRVVVIAKSSLGLEYPDVHEMAEGPSTEVDSRPQLRIKIMASSRRSSGGKGLDELKQKVAGRRRTLGSPERFHVGHSAGDRLRLGLRPMRSQAFLPAIRITDHCYPMFAVSATPCDDFAGRVENRTGLALETQHIAHCRPSGLPLERNNNCAGRQPYKGAPERP